jgi:hypothetical protein
MMPTFEDSMRIIPFPEIAAMDVDHTLVPVSFSSEGVRLRPPGTSATILASCTSPGLWMMMNVEKLVE